MAPKHWWSRVYTNEIFLICPCLTWWKIRKSKFQRTADIARTVPLITLVAVAAARNQWPHTAVIAAIAAWTVAANFAMHAADEKAMRDERYKKYFEFDTQGEILFAMLIVSPLSFVAGSPAWLTGIEKDPAWYIAAAINITVAAYIAAECILAAPYTDAWACYPPPRNLAELKYGYCPQKTGSIEPYNACVYIGDKTEACSPDTWNERDRNLAHTVSAAAHAAARIIAVSASAYIADIPQCVYRMKEKLCRKSQ